MKPVKTGFVGFGSMVERVHLEAMRECGLFELVGACDVTASRRLAAKEQGLAATEDLYTLLNWDVELVVIGTPSVSHHEIALQAADAGCHMLIEKPLAITAQAAREIVAAARQNKVALAVYHNRHFDLDYRQVKAAVREGLLGELYSVENRTLASRPAIAFGTAAYDQQWRVTTAAGGGTLHDFGPHWVEQVLDLTGDRKVVQVFADVRHFKWGDANDHFKIELVFDDGLRATVGKSDVAYRTLPPKWLILGSEATLHGPEDQRVVITGSEYELYRTAAVGKQNIHENLAAHIREGTPLIIPPECALRVMEVLQAAMDSAEKGQSVDVSL